MGKYFGTDGFRGEANVALTVEHAFKIGRFLGWYFGRDHKATVVIGKDTRRSSYMFEPRHHDAERILRYEDGGLRLRHNDLRKSQQVLR